MAAKPLKLSIAPTQAVTLQLKRVTLTPTAHDAFLTYKRAFAEIYSTDIDDDELAAQLITLALKNDRSLMRYRQAKRTRQEGQGSAAPEQAHGARAAGLGAEPAQESE
ncbi:hypothetical protein FFK22_038590 [Mycobacterium sp. KBS0706]|uniref:hypothetical protein n=1 Tax=Mycobacterium sp. KBS0706 TaxID=2578109 RepID=UPI00110FE74D|nr:hypothetical protein [Mycobacterium sp. KBS0706]TSD83276.1 hypothetical protein FFK22_038590 [Mycobacterium sp. KBS0706]